MKLYVCIAIFAAVFSAVLAAPASPSVSVAGGAQEAAEAEQGAQSSYDFSRFRKSAYGSGATIAAPPCPKNYLFSCQPNLAPVGCAAPAYGSAGAYSAPIPSYAAPLQAAYNPLQVAYNPNQFFQY